MIDWNSSLHLRVHHSGGVSHTHEGIYSILIPRQCLSAEKDFCCFAECKAEFQIRSRVQQAIYIYPNFFFLFLSHRV